MEEEQELKQHVCKFCSKSFSCGRSLGGHMRSHMINDISAQADGTKLTKKKLPSLANYFNNGPKSIINNNPTTTTTTTSSTEITGYGLRGNPKKTRRIAPHHQHSSEDTSLVDKSCKDCGRVFQSWKALFGHMKCHSVEKDKDKASSLEEEQQDSWASANYQKLVMDSQSDNETATPKRRRRSKRRTRYMGDGGGGTAAANSSSLSFANNNNYNNNNNASSSISEIDQQEQEEVAMCLMMLSRDVGQWVGGGSSGGGLNSVAESSDNNSEFLDDDNNNNNNLFSSKTEGKTSICNGTEIVKVKPCGDKELMFGKLEDDDSKVESKKSEFSISEIARKKFPKNAKSKKSHNNDEYAAENFVVELGKNLARETEMTSRKCNENKRKLDPELKPDDFQNSDRDSRFKCTTCNKVFHSFQALGGHRASHKKTKGCFASRIDSSENSIGTEPSPDPKKSIKNEIPVDQSATDCENNYGARKSKGHECPICLKVFPSGQALGGHKRSHLVAPAAATTHPQAKNNQNNNITIQDSIPPPIRDFLDLNLPAPVEEESNGLVGFNPWWITSNHKHEQLVGLISN